MFKRIAHICLYVKNLRKSIDYYSRLGFTEVFKFTRNGNEFGVYLQISPENYIEIFEDKNRGPVVNNGIAHFCLQSDDIDSVMKKLTSAGMPFTPKKMGCDNTYQIWLTDPDGNQFEVHQYTDNSLQIKGGGSVEADW